MVIHNVRVVKHGAKDLKVQMVKFTVQIVIIRYGENGRGIKS